MFKILNKEKLSVYATSIVIEAPFIAEKAKPAQYVVLIIDENSERMPLKIVDWDKNKGTITLVIQNNVVNEKKVENLKIGDNILHILGPLGRAIETKNLGEVYCLAEESGISAIYPVAKALKSSGNRITTILGARTKDYLIFENNMRLVSDELFITTLDGSYEKRGQLIDTLSNLFQVIERSTHTRYPDLVYCIGSKETIDAIAAITRLAQVKTIAWINFTDSPDFDAHKAGASE